MDYAGRLERAQQALRERAIAAFVAGPSADLYWLTGYQAPLLERLTLLVVGAEASPVLLVPELEAARAKQSGAADRVELATWSETEDAVQIAADLLERAGVDGSARVAVQDALRASFLLRLQDARPGVRWHLGAEVSSALRVCKTPEEIEALRAAGAAIDGVHERVPELLRAGRTEAQVARDIGERILEDHDTVNFVIVGSGPNGASPHHEAGDRVIVDGDPVVVDIGGTRNGYCSDMTRNYLVGSDAGDYGELHEVLLEAQKAGVARVRPGVTAEEVDAACRDLLDEAGYGEYFVHRTGHGIGVEEHEEPYIVQGSDTVLEPGMVFSVEPGIYLPGRHGARIEDIVVVTEDGCERLNRVSRDLVLVASTRDAYDR